MLKFSASQQKHVLKLLHMRYTAAEIAEIVGIDLSSIVNLCTDGCPHKIDDEGVTWIIGTDFQDWLKITDKWRGPCTKENQLINRENFFDVSAFLDYRTKILQFDQQSVRNRWIELRHLLQWVGPIPLWMSPKIDPFFPVYLLTARNDGLGRPLCPGTLSRICFGARLFFEWAKVEWPDRYKDIPPTWIEAIRPQKSKLQSVLRKREVWSLEDVMKIANMQPQNICEQRDRAAVCFLYLSGMRITAFVTLPISCVDLDGRIIEQLPEKGVLTKNRKAGITSLLPIPELLRVVKEWDKTIRSTLRPTSPWYAPIDRQTMAIMDLNKTLRPTGRREAMIRGIKHLCEQAGIPYRSPHKLRHGHAVYGIKHAKDMKDLKAVSQNLMHSSISITDGIYGNLTSDDVNETIANLGATPTLAGDINILLAALVKLQQNPELLQRVLAA